MHGCSNRKAKSRRMDGLYNLSYVGLQGTISPQISNLSFLVSLDLTNNSFYGFLPYLRDQSSTPLEGTSLVRQRIGRQYPSNYRELLDLSLSYNNFDGSITKRFGSLENLELLYLGGNKLTGNVPPIISNLSVLQEFYIDSNNIKEPFQVIYGISKI